MIIKIDKNYYYQFLLNNMVIHHVSLRILPFNNIINSKKNIEVRLLKGIFSKINVNDYIIYL